MKKNEKQEKSFPMKMSGKGRVIGLVLCFAAAIVMIGTYTFRSYQEKLNAEIAKSEELAKSMEEEANQEANANDIVIPESETDVDSDETTTEDGDMESVDENAGQAAASDAAESVWFSPDTTLAWPASGSVILEYSMDHTIYFPTLAEYRYNPALIIGGAAGEDIRAGAAGSVTDITADARTGNTVTLDLGNGYTAIYGQLKDVPLNVGDYVEQGSIVGYLSEPTKYYSEEGTNLYFAMQKDGEAVNPMDFME
ncbi:MAG: peptidoglycan DD-metalloendopeptidase family protein [Hespellia sp.]|nr:peptidoglycan DD-metalloendopeptidase family protein [Hespellia sp.]